MRMIHEPGPDRIVVDVSEGENELTQAIEDPGMEAFTPYVPGQALLPVVRHGEYPEYPSHDRRQAFPFHGFNEEMHMISHDTEVP